MPPCDRRRIKRPLRLAFDDRTIRGLRRRERDLYVKEEIGPTEEADVRDREKEREKVREGKRKREKDTDRDEEGKMCESKKETRQACFRRDT